MSTPKEETTSRVETFRKPRLGANRRPRSEANRRLIGANRKRRPGANRKRRRRTGWPGADPSPPSATHSLNWEQNYFIKKNKVT
jgi:hypothetical protein